MLRGHTKNLQDSDLGQEVLTSWGAGRIMSEEFRQLPSPWPGACAMSRVLSAVLVLGLLTTSASAQSFTGTYTMSNNTGGALVLTLQQGGDGNVTGTLSGNGTTFQVQGVLEDDAVVGAVTTPNGGLYFEAYLLGAELEFTLIEPDANGDPNYDTAEDLLFARQDGVTAAPMPAGGGVAGANPLAAANPLTMSDPLVGTFSDGNLVLQLEGGNGSYTGQIQLSGQTFPLTAQGSEDNVTGTFGTGDGEFPLALSHSQGTVTLATGGTSYVLQRVNAQSGGGANPLAGRGSSQAVEGSQASLGDNTPVAREWIQWLAGKKVTTMSSYSSGSAGGYSSRTDVHLCSSGEFLYRDNSSVTVDVPGASGYSGGQQGATGRWKIITQGNLVGIELRYSSGNVETYQLGYEGGATYANGERVYVTASDVCL
jgi:hypothetical protein